MSRPASEGKGSRYQQIAMEVAKRIADGDYEVGEKLKSRSTLSAQFNVSPETTRKALNILADLKIVTLKHGSGAIVLSQEKANSFIENFETKHSIAVIKEKIRDNIQNQRDEMEKLHVLVNDFLMQSQSVSRHYSLVPFEIIANKPCDHFEKTIEELEIWKQTRATLIAVEHKGQFLLSPDPKTRISKGDHIYFIGDDDAYLSMKGFFNLKMGL